MIVRLILKSEKVKKLILKSAKSKKLSTSFELTKQIFKKLKNFEGTKEGLKKPEKVSNNNSRFEEVRETEKITHKLRKHVTRGPVSYPDKTVITVFFLLKFKDDVFN